MAGGATIAEFVRSLTAIWWLGSVAVVFTSFLAAVVFPSRLFKRAYQRALPPVTAITPVKHLDAEFRESLTSLFDPQYPDLETIIASNRGQSPTLIAECEALANHSSVPFSFRHSRLSLAVSPKLNALWLPIAEATHDVVLTKDANVLLASGDLENFVSFLTPNVGLVSTILVASEPQSAAAWIEASIINGYHARLLMLAATTGFGFGCGKIMLFRRSDLERAGGLSNLAWALGEDAALASAMDRIGLGTVFADRVSYQPLGVRHLREIFDRQLRWMLIRRFQTPAAFFGEFLGLALPTAIAAAIAAPLFHLSTIALSAATFFCCFALETVLCLIKGWEISLWSPLAFVCREMLLCAVWLRAWTTNKVVWSGTPYRLQRDPQPPAAAKMPMPQDVLANDGL